MLLSTSFDAATINGLSTAAGRVRVAHLPRPGSKRWITVLAIWILLLSVNRSVVWGADAGAGADGGKIVGIITHFEYNWTKAHGPKPDLRLSLKAEGDSDSVDYVLALPDQKVDPKLEAALQKVFPSNTATLQWEMRDGKRLVTRIAVISPTSGQGTVIGTIMAQGDGYLDVKGAAHDAITARYVIIRPTPTALSNAIKDLNVGDRVKITWIANFERMFFSQIQIISRAPAPKRTPSEPK